MWSSALCSLCCFLLYQLFGVNAVTSFSHSFSHDSSAGDNNPFRGFTTSYSWGIYTDFPLSLEFNYIPLRDVQLNYTEFNWTVLENILDSVSSRGHHSILRFYLDYPNKDTGIPQFLIDSGLLLRNYSNYGGGYCPDYNNSNLQLALLNFIEYFGNIYNGDNRIALIQAGLLGFWGEWHVYPHNNWLWTDEFGLEILEAYKTAFDTTLLNVRSPNDNTHSVKVFGYHDDSFTYSTLSNTTDWYFYPLLELYNETNRYKKSIMGGELRPENQDIIFTNEYIIGDTTQNWTQCVKETHISYLLFAYAYSTGWDNNTFEENALKGMREMGYDIGLMTCDINVNNSTMQVDISNSLKNWGIAPFYYDLMLLIGFKTNNSMNNNNFTVKTGDLSYLFTNEMKTIDVSVDISDILTYDNIGDDDVTSVTMEISLYSTMMLDNNPIRLTNSETNTTNGKITIENAFILYGNYYNNNDDMSTSETPNDCCGNTPDSSANRMTRAYSGLFLTVFISILFYGVFGTFFE